MEHVSEPLACTLSTVAADGGPDSRVIVLKGVSGSPFALEIATSSCSAKATQLSAEPKCALSFHWIPLARAIRIRGTAVRGSTEESKADFEKRGFEAKAVALVGRQSQVVGDADVDAEIEAARHQLRSHPEATPGWDVWRIEPTTIEFWQGSRSRNHTRLRYMQTEGDWVHERLWA